MPHPLAAGIEIFKVLLLYFLKSKEIFLKADAQTHKELDGVIRCW
jgi:hypothetical protein